MNLPTTKILAKTINNRFWKDMGNSLIKLKENFKIKNTTHLNWMPLQYNNKVIFEYRKSWEQKGYNLVSELLHENGEILLR